LEKPADPIDKEDAEISTQEGYSAGEGTLENADSKMLENVDLSLGFSSGST
jgi:hypothetical protein